jgi:G:T/U-mismatch repair DNA glycosylase
MDDTKKDTHHPQDLADSLLLVTREKEAARMKRSEAMLDFLREKRRQKDQLLREQEKTKRIAAQAELVKNLVEAGFTKGEIYQQLQRL